MTNMRLLVTTLFVLLCYQTTHAYDNAYDGPLHHECPTGQALYKVYSVHNNYYEDRKWGFDCRPCPALSDGQQFEWYNDVNAWDRELHFMCSSRLQGGVLCGVRSYHDNYYEDRRWSFKCCKPSGDRICEVSTTTTGFLNNFDSALNWQTPSASDFMVGFYSYHDNVKEDRRWKVFYGQPTCTDECACSSVYDADWEVDDIDYQLNSYTQGPGQPETVATQNIDNNSDTAETTQSVTLTGGVTETSMFSNKVGVSTSISTSFKTKIPLVAENGITVSVQASYDHTWGTTTSYNKAFGTTFSVTVPPNTHVTARAIMTKTTLSVPFTMTLRHKERGCVCRVEGVWGGVEHYNLRYVIEDKQGHDMSSMISSQG